jgi:hypothetical protein
MMIEDTGQTVNSKASTKFIEKTVKLPEGGA